jgi:hypothetical protein
MQLLTFVFIIDKINDYLCIVLKKQLWQKQ